MASGKDTMATSMSENGRTTILMVLASIFGPTVTSTKENGKHVSDMDKDKTISNRVTLTLVNINGVKLKDLDSTNGTMETFILDSSSMV